MTPIVEIVRLQEFEETGTLGIMKINKEVFCFTLEPPDRDNLSNISNIPEQQYYCERYNSNKFGETFKILDVPRRRDILFHTGNQDEDTEGCILLGEHKYNTFGRLINSVEIFRTFMVRMTSINKFHLTIYKHY